MIEDPHVPWIDFNLYLITDRNATKDRPLTEVVEEALRAGVRAVQLREKDMSAREMYELAYELRKVTTRHGARLFINDRIDVALAVDADGVHLAGHSLPIHRARKILGEKKLIGVSCHNQISAITAQEKGADFITFGPVYVTPSKAKYGKPVGPEKLADITHILQIPVFALGGITTENMGEAIGAGAFGIALISGIISAQKPLEAARTFLARLPSIHQTEP